MVHFTFFEIHLDDATFEANAPFASKGEEPAADEEDQSSGIGSPATEGEEGPPKAAQLVAGLVFMVLVAAVVRKLRNRGGDESVEAVEPEELDVEAA